MPHRSHAWESRKALPVYPSSPSALPRSREPAARAMPPLTGVGERCAPRATWSCIDEPLKSPGRSRSTSLPTPVKGRFSRHRLLRAPGMSTVPATPPSLKLPGMLDEPVGSLLLSLEKQLRQSVVPSLVLGQRSSNPHRESGTPWRVAADGGPAAGR
jgi:hypothetical protein